MHALRGKQHCLRQCVVSVCRARPVGVGSGGRSIRSPASAAAATVDAPADTPPPVYKPRRRIAEIWKGEQQGAAQIGKQVEIKGWVRTLRAQKTFAFVEIYDGSCMAGLQVVVNDSVAGYDLVGDGSISTGCSVAASGELVESLGGKQTVELKASSLRLIGACDPSTYPLQKKRHGLDFLRGIAHLRARTNVIGAVMRVRSALAQATHDFFAQNGFLYVHTPIISAADCEGAGEMFQVTTLLSRLDAQSAAGPGKSVEQLAEAVASQGAAVKEAKGKAKESGSEEDAAAAQAAIELLLKLKEQSEAARRAEQEAQIPKTQSGAVDYAQDFFGRRAYLTVSGQLNGEMYASALGDVYTFGPTFRAENSNTSRHLAEFWMIEPELAFADLSDDIDCAEAYLKHCVAHILEHCAADLQFFDQRVEKGLLARLRSIAARPFVRCSYTDAVAHLTSSGADFEFPVTWGCDLQSEHERHLTEVVFEGVPVFVTDYPKDIKAFYMRLNDDGKTVAAMDLLVPRVGELIGGSQREDRIAVLLERMAQVGLEAEDYGPYLDLRKYGSVPHAGFGLGFERLVQFATGAENIRDVIPFPRYPGHAEF